MLTKVKKGKSVVTASIALLFLILFLNFNRANLEIFEYSPRRVKMLVTESGASDKEVVRNQVKKILKIRHNLEIDASDALAVAISHGKSILDKEVDIESV